MSEVYSDHREFVFGDFTLDVDRASLYRGGKEISLRPKAFDVLRYLVERQGRLVSRDELHDAIWGTTVVTDDAVTQCLIDIRKALADSSQSIVRTVPRRGYVFELPVTRPANPASASEPAADAPRLRRTVYVRWDLSLIAVALLGLLIVWLLTVSNQGTSPKSDAQAEIASDPTIAVLPFSVLSDDPSESHFADGVSEEILNLLARQRGLRVIARTSSFAFRDHDIATVAEQLGVSHVLEGSIRNDGDRIRIGVQLIDAATSESLWTERFERALSASNIFAIQDEIAKAVSESLKAEIPGLEYHAIAKIPTDNLDALDAYFQGRARMETRLPEHLLEASTLFENAIEHDPDFALAHVALADVSLLRNIHGNFPLRDAFQQMKHAVDAALAIDDQIGEAYVPLGNLLWWQYGDLRGAERAYQRGIELSPSYAPLYQWYAEFLAFALARPHDALPYSKMSLALDPRSAVIAVNHASVLAHTGRLDQALEQVDRAIEIDPDLPISYLVKAGVLRLYAGKLAEALPLYEQAHSKSPRSAMILTYMAGTYFDLGDFEQAETRLRAASLLAPQHIATRSEHARAEFLRGDRASALETARALLDDAPGLPDALVILRDHYLREREHEKALELYRRYYAPLFDESSSTVELPGWAYPATIDLSVLLLEMGRNELAEKLLAAALAEAELRERLGIGPPDTALARIHALRGDSDAAIDALQGAVDDGWRAGWRLALYHDPALDSLRDLPEFQRIVTRVEADIAQQRRDLEAAYGPLAGSAIPALEWPEGDERGYGHDDYQDLER